MKHKYVRKSSRTVQAAYQVISAQAYLADDQYDKALAILEEVYPHVVGLGPQYSNPLWLVEYMISEIYRHQGNVAGAIYFGKKSVNRLESIRNNLQTLKSEQQLSFLDDKKRVYRSLADMFVEVGDIATAEHIIRLLKNFEYDDFIRRTSLLKKEKQPVGFSSSESRLAININSLGGDLTAINKEISKLRRHKLNLSKEERRNLKVLESRRRVLYAEFKNEMTQIKREFASLGIERVIELGEKNLGALGALQSSLKRLPENAAFIHFLVLPDKVRMIVTTKDASVSYKSEIEQTKLNELVFDFRHSLSSPGDFDLEVSSELYALLISPIRSYLLDTETNVLMLSLDGVLRYLPFSALHNGDEYLAEEFELALYTPAAATSIEHKPTSWKIASFGVSKGSKDYPPLRAVPGELDEIVLEHNSDKKGVIPGIVVLDESFTPERFAYELTRSEPFQVVHLATHFDFQPGKDLDSSLLFGNGELIPITEFKHGTFPLGQVELLTLSACNTALSGIAADGSELEGFTALAQNQGASSIISTLWSVADESTSRFMSRFYDLKNNGNLTKSRAIKSVQMEFINDPIYSDPFFWAPFTLTGNWL